MGNDAPERIKTAREILEAEFKKDHADMGFRVVVQVMDSVGFTFIKRETEVGFLKLIDASGDAPVQEPHVIEAFEDIPQPRKWQEWVPASHKAAMKAMKMYGGYMIQAVAGNQQDDHPDRAGNQGN